jgi:MFS family permease
MSMPTTGPSRLTAVQWLICIIAVIGFAFDTYELLMLPLILRPALNEFGIRPGTSEFTAWAGALFFLPAVAGGIFGLLGGYLTDRLGRRRVLTWSILIYAVSAFLGGYSTGPYMFLILRTTKFIGVCVEFVAAVAWLAELFPDYAQRERVLGYTQAFSSFGGLLVALANSMSVRWATSLPAIEMPAFLSSLGTVADPHAPWRYTMISGLIPAIPLMIIRPFLPESPTWKQKKQSGTLKRPSIAELFAPRLRSTTIITTVMFALSFGAAFGAIQQMPQIAPGMPEVVAAVKQKLASEETQQAIDKRLNSPEVAKMLAGKSEEDQAKVRQAQTQIARKQLSAPIEQSAAANYTKVQEIGGLIGRFALALLVVRIASRRALLRVFQIPGLIVLPIVFGYVAMHNQQLFTVGSWHVSMFDIGMFLAGFFTVAQFSFWGNYLPTVYPLHLRGTGESFSANIGGRMVGTSFAALAQWVASLFTEAGTTDPTKIATAMALTAGGIGLTVYLLGLIMSFFLPEPPKEMVSD